MYRLGATLLLICSVIALDNNSQYVKVQNSSDSNLSVNNFSTIEIGVINSSYAENRNSSESNGSGTGREIITDGKIREEDPDTVQTDVVSAIIGADKSDFIRTEQTNKPVNEVSVELDEPYFGVIDNISFVPIVDNAASFTHNGSNKFPLNNDTAVGEIIIPINGTKTRFAYDYQFDAYGNSNGNKQNVNNGTRVASELNTIDIVREENRTSSIVFNKCVCPPSSVKIYKDCFPATPTIEVISNPLTDERNTINSTALEWRKEELKCLRSDKFLQLNDTEYSLALNGLLYYKGYTAYPDQYCLDFIEEDTKRFWVAVVCIDAPVIRRCCPKGHFFSNVTLQCEPSQIIDPNYDLKNLPISITYPIIGVNITDNYQIPVCENSEVLTVLSLGQHGSNESELFYDLKGVELDVRHPDLSYIQHYKSNDFCLAPAAKKVERGYVAIVCYENPIQSHRRRCSQFKTCVRKCCPEEQVYDAIQGKCSESTNRDNLYKPQIFRSAWYDEMIPQQPSFNYGMVYGTPLCSAVRQYHGAFSVLDDGSAFTNAVNFRFTSEYYCVDNQQGYDGQLTTSLFFCEDHAQPFGDSCQRVKLSLTRILMAISIIFLILTLVVCKIVYELHAYISGKNLTTHVFSLLMAFICSFVINVADVASNSVFFCVILACLTQYFFLATFFWLSSMCFELWYRSRFSPNRANSASESRHKYKLYALFGWGGPLAVVSITLLVQLSVRVDSAFVPHFANPFCWFRDDAALWIYFNAFIMVLCSANFLFFVDMARIYMKQCMDSTFIHISKQIYAERSLLYLKLFLVMGVTWIFEQISEIGGSCSSWLPMDVVNMLRGLFVFLSIISSRTVIKKLRSRTAAWCRCSKPTYPTGGKTNTAVDVKQSVKPSLSRRIISSRRKPSVTSSQNSDYSVPTEETPVDPKSESSVSSKPLELSSLDKVEECKESPAPQAKYIEEKREPEEVSKNSASEHLESGQGEDPC